MELTRIFTVIGDSGIRYCSWKSNANLNASFKCLTDFDLLVAEKDADTFRSLMAEYGLKRRYSTADKIYPGMEDYIGFEERTGRLFHLHVHYKLVMGRRYRKNYRIPIETAVLQDAVMHDEYPIMVIKPEWELLLLLIRSSVKTRITLRFMAKAILKKAHQYPKNIHDEFVYLLGKCDVQKWGNYGSKYFPGMTRIIEEFPTYFQNGFTCSGFLRFRRRIIRSIRGYLMLRGLNSLWSTRERIRAAKSSRSYLKNGGSTFAFIGVDGSGKSTVVPAIKKWLAWKISVTMFYMGKPKENIGMLRIIDGLIWCSYKIKLNFLANSIKDIRWVYIAHLRYKYYKSSVKLKGKKWVVLFERYPLPEFRDMEVPMDGPRLPEKSFWGKMEKKYYRSTECPDRVFVLQVNEREAIKRKKEHITEKNRKMIKMKIDAIKGLVSQNKYIIVDAMQPKDKVLLEIKRSLWGTL